ncbi:MAG: hypothetical protein IT442_02495 [Phycisphaeraceae bacterium]|nr:hypothetical protein [Phycisphaeraceae bacterium]
MTDLLAQSAAWLDQMRLAHLSQLVTYERGGTSIQIAATLGTTTYEVTDDTGATVQAQATDFIVSAGDLVLGGQITTPRIGDRIWLTQGTTERLFEVLDLAGVGHYRPCDPHGRMLRIHAKQIDQEDVP